MKEQPPREAIPISDGGYAYIGDGAFLSGVPARDLSASDVAALDADAITTIEASGLYRKVN